MFPFQRTYRIFLPCVNAGHTAQATTKAIRNAGKVLYINILTINKISGKLKSNRFEIPYYA